MTEHRNALKPGYRLHWYVVRGVLGQGGFGITYLADDTNLNQPVAIKEFLPTEMAVRDGDASVQPLSGERGDQYRWGLDRFIQEARTLAQFKHPNIVRVFTVFTENNTAYMVMEYEQGQGLHELLKQRAALPEAELLRLILPVMDGLEGVHQRGFIHRDIKPANIFVREAGTPVLLDFGSARQAFSEATRTLTTLVSPGFAPFEQYTGKSDRQGPWTDIYGLGATLYRAAIGRPPPDAMNRSEALLQGARDPYVRASEIGPPGYSRPLLQAIDRALQFQPEDRPQSIREWRDQLHAPEAATAATERRTGVSPAAAVNSAAGPGAAAPAAAPRPRPRRGWAFAAVALSLALAIALASGRHRTEVAPAAPAPGAASGANSPPAQAAEPAAAATPAGSDAGSAPARAATETASAAPAAAAPLVGPDEREKLALIRRRLVRNPDDPEARQRLRVLAARFDLAIGQAVREGDYDRAEGYVDEMLRLTPDNARLREARAAIERARGAPR